MGKRNTVRNRGNFVNTNGNPLLITNEIESHEIKRTKRNRDKMIQRRFDKLRKEESDGETETDSIETTKNKMK